MSCNNNYDVNISLILVNPWIKRIQTALKAKITYYGVKKESFLKILNIEDHEREIRVRKVITDLEDRQIQFK